MPETPEDATMPPQPAAVADATETFPRVRRGADEPTRLDARRLFEVGEPTVTTGPFSPTDDHATMRASVRVSPIGTHTGGAGYHTGGPVSVADTVNRLLDERDRARDLRDGRAAARTGRTVREEAQRRAAAKLRHERHLEILETARAYLSLATIFLLLVVVVGAGVVAYGILTGYFVWQPVHVDHP